MSENSKKPNPGSEEARKMGCTCPVLDNHYGRGFKVNGEFLFWISRDCPVHGSKEEDNK